MTYISHNDKSSIRVKINDYALNKLDNCVKTNITTRSVILEGLVDLYLDNELPQALYDHIEQRRDEYLRHLEEKKKREFNNDRNK